MRSSVRCAQRSHHVFSGSTGSLVGRHAWRACLCLLLLPHEPMHDAVRHGGGSWRSLGSALQQPAHLAARASTHSTVHNACQEAPRHAQQLPACTHSHALGACAGLLHCLQLSNTLSSEALFYTCIIPFILFFGSFAAILYPMRDTLHPTGKPH